jgi:hypothetical protein
MSSTWKDNIIKQRDALKKALQDNDFSGVAKEAKYFDNTHKTNPAAQFQANGGNQDQLDEIRTLLKGGAKTLQADMGDFVDSVKMLINDASIKGDVFKWKLKIREAIEAMKTTTGGHIDDVFDSIIVAVDNMPPSNQGRAGDIASRGIETIGSVMSFMSDQAGKVLGDVMNLMNGIFRGLENASNEVKSVVAEAIKMMDRF